MKATIRMMALIAGCCLAFAGGVVADEVKSLRGSDTNQSEVAPEPSRLQDGVKLERAFRQAPPLVPHTTDKYEVDLKVNQCLRCHEWPYSDQEKAPKITDSHYVDAAGVRRDQVTGTRYFCTQCHVPQADAKPLVNNNFKSVAPGR